MRSILENTYFLRQVMSLPQVCAIITLTTRLSVIKQISHNVQVRVADRYHVIDHLVIIAEFCKVKIFKGYCVRIDIGEVEGVIGGVGGGGVFVAG